MVEGPIHFDDTIIVPYSDLLDSPLGGVHHRGGPRWQDWSTQVESRHMQGGRVADEEPEANAPLATVSEPLVWGGPIVRNYGHQISDFSMRLLPTVHALPQSRIAFASSERFGIAELGQAPAFFHQILDWFDIPRSRCEVISQPTLVRSLDVMPQAEQLNGPGPGNRHLDLIDAHTDAKLDSRRRRAKQLYVSRAGQRGRLAGEGYLEVALRHAGVDVIRPEIVSITEQVTAYHSADMLIFAEGSAIHTLQLAGRLPADMYVVTRRPGRRLAETSIAPRVQSLTYLDVAQGIVHGTKPFGTVDGVRRSPAPAPEVGISIPSSELLRAELQALDINVQAAWDEIEYVRERDNDVRTWMEAEARSGRMGLPSAIDTVRASLAKLGMGYLGADLARITGEPR